MPDSAVKPAGDAEATERFAARCAHDFNNLLTGILGNLELMQNRAKRTGVDTFDGYLEGARNAAGRAAGFSQRLLSYSGVAAQDPVPVPVNRLVADLVELMAEQGTPVAAALADDVGDAFCDPAQLEIALLELLGNARDADEGPGAVEIATASRDGFVVICVIDQGAGMTDEVLARATEPFFSTRPNGAGRGLGLAIVERFARHAGGSLELHGAPGAGTTARLVLPRV